MALGTKLHDTDTVVVTADEAGLVAGTTLMTMDGEMPVEHLSAGDRIITRDAGMVVLQKIESRRVRVKPIRIKAGSLGHTRPDRDMVVSPGAMLHIRDWRAEALFGAKAALVEASRLVDGEFLSQQEMRDMTVFTLTFDRQHILYADGVEVASAAV